MSGKVFLDTNVLIYFYSENEKTKRTTACKALNDNDCVTSTQTLSEASNVWFNKFKWDSNKIKDHIDNIESVCDDIAVVKKSTIDKALNLKNKYNYSYYDSLILATALESGCSEIFTEDLHDGQIIEDTLQVLNIFKA